MPFRGFPVDLDSLFRHTASALLAVFLLYCVVFAANLLGIPFYLGYRRYAMNIVLLTHTLDKFLLASSIVVFSTLLFGCQVKSGFKGSSLILIPLYVLVLIAVACVSCLGYEVLGVPALMALGLAFAVSSMLLVARAPRLILPVFYGMLILLGIEAASFARWIYNLCSPSLIFGDESWAIAFAEAQISNIFYPLLPAMLMFFSFSWIGEFTFKGLLTKGGKVKSESENSRHIYDFRFSKAPLTIALVSVVALLFIGCYNFAAAGLHSPAFLGTDVPWYINHLNDMVNAGTTEALGYAAKDDRFLYLVFQYFSYRLSSSSPEAFVTFLMPVALTFLLMLSTFVLVKTNMSSLHAATAMLVTVFSFQSTVGLYAGFYANWFALVFVHIFYGLLMAVLERPTCLWLLVPTGLSSLAVLYTHPWTWILLVIVIALAYMAVTLILISIRGLRLRKHLLDVKLLAVLLAVNVGMFYVKGYLGIGSGARLVDGYVDVEKFDISIVSAFSLKYFLDRTFNFYVGGFYAYPPMILFAILGVLSFLDYENRHNRLLLTWMLISSSMVFVEFPWHARFLYLTPFNIYAALGILYGAERLFMFAESRGLNHRASLAFWVFYILSILLLLNYAIRCATIKQFGPQGLMGIP